MKKSGWLLAAGLLLGLGSGCCSQPGLFDKVHSSLVAVQSFYGPLLQEDWSNDDCLKRVVVAADTTLLLAGELQRQWCPEPAKVEQLELQAGATQKLAQEAGVPAAAATDQEQGR